FRRGFDLRPTQWAPSRRCSASGLGARRAADHLRWRRDDGFAGRGGSAGARWLGSRAEVGLTVELAQLTALRPQPTLSPASVLTLAGSLSTLAPGLGNLRL